MCLISSFTDKNLIENSIHQLQKKYWKNVTPLGIWVFHSDTEFKQNKHEPSIISIALVGTQITKRHGNIREISSTE